MDGDKCIGKDNRDLEKVKEQFFMKRLNENGIYATLDKDEDKKKEPVKAKNYFSNKASAKTANENMVE